MDIIEELKEEEVVEIKKTDLQSLLERLDKVEKDNNMLLSVADKGRVSRYELINQEELIRTAKISFLKNEKGESKAVVAWRTVQDEVYIDANGVYRENQIIEIFFDDKKSQKIRYIDFVRLVEKREGEIIEKRQTKEGEIFKIQMKDGKEYELDIKFIN